MNVAFYGKNTFMTDKNTCDGVSNKVRLGIVVSVTEDMSKGNRIGGDEPGSTDETAVNRSRTELTLPKAYNIVIFLIMELREVSHEERRGRRARETTERRRELTKKKKKERKEEA